MTSPRQIGWSKKAILLYEISKQLEKLEGVWSNVTITDVEEVPEGAITTKDGLDYIKTKDGSEYITTKIIPLNALKTKDGSDYIKTKDNSNYITTKN